MLGRNIPGCYPPLDAGIFSQRLGGVPGFGYRRATLPNFSRWAANTTNHKPSFEVCLVCVESLVQPVREKALLLAPALHWFLGIRLARSVYTSLHRDKLASHTQSIDTSTMNRKATPVYYSPRERARTISIDDELRRNLVQASWVNVSPMILDAVHSAKVPGPILEEMAKRKSPEDIRALSAAMLPHAHRSALHLAAAGKVDYDDCLQNNMILIKDRLEKFDHSKTNFTVDEYIRSKLALAALDNHLAQETPRGFGQQARKKRGRRFIPMEAERMARFPVDPKNAIRRERQAELNGILETYVNNLGPQEQLIIRRVFGLGCDATPEAALAAELDISHQRVNQMKQEALRNIRVQGAKEKLRDFYQPEPDH